MSRERASPGDECTDCALAPSRRDFLRAVTLALTGVDALRRTNNAITYPVPAADGAQIDRKNEVILVRWEGAVYAFNLACPHQNVALRWQDKDRRFKCPKHNSRYEPDGTFIDGRATRGLDRFSIKLDGASIIVDVNAMHKQDADPAAWTAAMVRLPTDNGD